MTSYGDIWADIYDSVHTLTDDIPFWIQEAVASGGPVLELGSGTGRIAIPIAKSGVRVVGVDNSTAMLRIARAKARKLGFDVANLKFIKCDMRNFNLDQKFPLVIIPFHSFQALLSVADQYEALASIKKHLKPKGKLILTLHVPDINLLAQGISKPLFQPDVTNTNLANGHEIQVWHHNSYDIFNQITFARTIIKEVNKSGSMTNRTHRDYQLRYLYRFEAQYLLAACGYRVLDLFGSFDRDPLEESSNEMILVTTPSI